MRRKWWLLLLLVPLLVVVGFVVWGTQAPGPMPEALNALQSDAEVRVTMERAWTCFYRRR